jgi:hypothetical protein
MAASLSSFFSNDSNNLVEEVVVVVVVLLLWTVLWWVWLQVVRWNTTCLVNGKANENSYMIYNNNQENNPSFNAAMLLLLFLTSSERERGESTHNKRNKHQIFWEREAFRKPREPGNTQDVHAQTVRLLSTALSSFVHRLFVVRKTRSTYKNIYMYMCNTKTHGFWPLLT